MGPYSAGWKKFRRTQLLSVAILLGALPVLYVVGIIARWLNFELLATIAIIAVFVSFAVFAIRFQTFPCPRCGRCFSGDWWYNKSFLASECVHCGLPKFSDDGE